MSQIKVNSTKSEDGESTGARGKYGRSRRKHSKDDKEHRKTEDMTDSLLLTNHGGKNNSDKGNHEGKSNPEKGNHRRKSISDPDKGNHRRKSISDKGARERRKSRSGSESKERRDSIDIPRKISLEKVESSLAEDSLRREESEKSDSFCDLESSSEIKRRTSRNWTKSRRSSSDTDHRNDSKESKRRVSHESSEPPICCQSPGGHTCSLSRRPSREEESSPSNDQEENSFALQMKRRHTQPEIEHKLMLHRRARQLHRKDSPVDTVGMIHEEIHQIQSLATRRKSTPALMLGDKGVIDPESSLLKSLHKLAIGSLNVSSGDLTTDNLIQSGHKGFKKYFSNNSEDTITEELGPLFSSNEALESLKLNLVNCPNSSTLQCDCGHINCPCCNLLMNLELTDPTLLQ